MSQWYMKGFTLPELMVTLSIAAILVTLATPSYVNFIQKNEALVMANQLVSDLNTARMKGLSMGHQTFLCPIADGATYVCGNETQWSNGWRVYQDATGLYTANASNLLQESNYQNTTGVTMTVTPSNLSKFAYNALGSLSTTPFTVTFRPVTCVGSQVQTVSVSSSGSVSKETTGC